jgi:hypothetical protein
MGLGAILVKPKFWGVEILGASNDLLGKYVSWITDPNLRAKSLLGAHKVVCAKSEYG